MGLPVRGQRTRTQVCSLTPGRCVEMQHLSKTGFGYSRLTLHPDHHSEEVEQVRKTRIGCASLWEVCFMLVIMVGSTLRRIGEID